MHCSASRHYISSKIKELKSLHNSTQSSESLVSLKIPHLRMITYGGFGLAKVFCEGTRRSSCNLASTRLVSTYKRLFSRSHFPDTDIIFILYDGISEYILNVNCDAKCKKDKSILRELRPVVVPAESRDQSLSTISMPSFHWDYIGWGPEKMTVDSMTESFVSYETWMKRKPVLVWRGNPNNHVLRKRLVKIGRSSPIVDAKEGYHGEKNYFSINKQLEFRYSVATPGLLNMYSGRLKFQLVHFAVLFLFNLHAHSTFAEWYFVGLKNNVHFKRGTISTMLTKLRKWNSNPQIPFRIMNASRHFIKTQTGDVCARHHIYSILKYYPNYRSRDAFLDSPNWSQEHSKDYFSLEFNIGKMHSTKSLDIN